MSNIIDRRLNPKDKTLTNRQKFVQRSRDEIKKAVKESIDKGQIADIEEGKAKIKVKGISEPTFTLNPKLGDKKYVMPGNKEFIQGDKQDKPKEGDGSGGTAGGLGRSEDEFDFVLNQQEYLDFIFEDLELPDMIKKQMKDVTKVRPKRAGFTNTGNPSQLDVVRSLKNSMGRRIGLKRPKNEDIEVLENELEFLTARLESNPFDAVANSRYKEIVDLLEEMKRRQLVIPWLDPFDVRFRNFTPQPQPMTKAVMICIMDVSGSMGQNEKDLAKRFFFLLHMFLMRKYTKVDIVFIRHHEAASEVTEEEFFNSKESGGTVVSTSLKLAKEIIDSRYNINDWNIFISQASDGDNYGADKVPTLDMMYNVLPLVQYFAYVEITSAYRAIGTPTDLWATYASLTAQYLNLNMQKVVDVKGVWTVFKKLFEQKS